MLSSVANNPVRPVSTPMNALPDPLPHPAPWRSALEDYIRRNARPVDKFSHQQRLYRLAVSLAEGRPFDDDVVHAAVWLHDLGVFVGHRPEDLAALAAWDHVAYVCGLAPTLLADMGFPAAKVPAVLGVIRDHLPSSRPTSFEGTLVRDADILEQLGAVAILRTVSKVGRDTRFLRFADALRVLRRNVGTLPGQLLLDSSRRAAAARTATLNGFLAAAAAEAPEDEM